jgi:N-acetylneuraminate lyase
LLELCSIPNVVGLKFTDFDLFRMRRLVQEGAVIFNGRDEVVVAGLLMGASGGIGTFYNVLPELFVQLYDCSQRGSWNEARLVQDRINTIIQIVLAYPVFPAMKQMLQWMGVDCGECIQPRGNLDAGQSTLLKKQLDDSGITFPWTICGS